MSAVTVVDDVRGNGRKKVLVIGITGAGKSSLCNALTGNEFSNGDFAIGHDPNACTRETKFGEAFFCGNKERPFTIVDTIGFADPDLESDQEIIVELVKTLTNFCDHINAIIILINGANVRLDAGLIAIIKILEGIFTKDMWNYVCIIFSHMSMDMKSVNARKNKKNKTDTEYGTDMIQMINDTFPASVGLLSQYFIVDCTFDKEDTEESKEFEKNTELFYKFFDSKPGLSTNKATIVETENVALKKKLDEDKKATEELKKAMEDLRLRSEAEKVEIYKQMEKQMAESGKENDEIKARLKMFEENKLRDLTRARKDDPNIVAAVSTAMLAPALFLGKSAEKGVKEVSKGVEKGAKEVVKVVDKGAKEVGKGVEKGAKEVRRFFKKRF